ncbi:MAG: sigma-70 family RNA polymerase sigma factor [Solirubrobacteraceae bacterium]
MAALAVSTRPAAQTRDDHELVAAVRDGDDRAFELLFERYQRRIAAYVRSMVRDHGRAEDITQEVFLAALRRIRATDREIAFKPWIFEIAKNACIDAFRRARNTQDVSLDSDDALCPSDQRRLTSSGSAPDTVMESKLALDNLCGAFGGLSQTHHDILVMREFDGLSYREIGERLRMTQGAVESTLFRARRRLGEEYEEIASGERCAHVRGVVDARSGRSLGLRDRRRMCGHVSRCQPCRRYALRAGVDIDTFAASGPRIARVAALLPLPAFLRRRPDLEQAGQLFAPHAPAVNLVSVLDPAAVSGWGKAILAAATVAVAGLGAGAAVDQRGPLAGLGDDEAPAFVAPSPQRSAVDRAVSSRAPEPATAITSNEPAVAKESKAPPSTSGGSSSGDAPPVKQQKAAPTGLDAATGEPAAAPLRDLLGHSPGAAAVEQRTRPGIVKGVVGLLTGGGGSTGAGGASQPVGSVSASGGNDLAAAQSQGGGPLPITELKPVKALHDVTGDLTAGPE